ncbi:MAG TPA: hypothetical protein VD815_04850 [Candidatus Saccharimonadales bacterium]|nr:hypothetical protein [Candidatus Saccharimonadales bacterium]
MLVFTQDIAEILRVITWILDLFAVTIIAVSVFQALVSRPFAKFSFLLSPYTNGLSSQSKNNKDFKEKLYKGNTTIRNLVSGLLLALEFESASAIIKLGIFTTSITMPHSISNNLDEFIFIVSILFLRIVLNQSLRRFTIIR